MSNEIDNHKGIIRATIMGFVVLSIYLGWTYFQGEFSWFKSVMVVCMLLLSIFYVISSVKWYTDMPDNIDISDQVLNLNGNYVVLTGGFKRVIKCVCSATGAVMIATIIKVIASN